VANSPPADNGRSEKERVAHSDPIGRPLLARNSAAPRKLIEFVRRGGRLKVERLSQPRTGGNGGRPMETISIDSLRNTADARQALADADVVIGVDVDSQRVFTVFGTPALEESIQFVRGGALRMVRVSVNKEAGELEQLVAMVQAIKGRHEYFPGDE
jgi:hypothetical protein